MTKLVAKKCNCWLVGDVIACFLCRLRYSDKLRYFTRVINSDGKPSQLKTSEVWQRFTLNVAMKVVNGNICTADLAWHRRTSVRAYVHQTSFFLRWQYLSQCGSAQTAPSAEKRPQCRMFLSAQLPARSVENFWACQCHLSLAGQLHLRTLIINSGSSGRGKPSQTSHMWRATTTKP